MPQVTVPPESANSFQTSLSRIFWFKPPHLHIIAGVFPHC